MYAIKYFIPLILFVGCTGFSEGNKEMENISSGYIGNVEEWKNFLSCWESQTLEILAYNEPYTEMEKTISRQKKQGFKVATDFEIKSIENDLSESLPKSIIDFWKASSGWRNLSMDGEDGLIFGPDEVGWTKTLYPRIVPKEGEVLNEISDQLYFDYSKNQDTVNYREAYIKSTLAVSQLIDSAVYLLNPEILTKDGEWEAWYLGFELPGAMRFKSFAHLMLYAYENSASSIGVSEKGINLCLNSQRLVEN